MNKCGCQKTCTLKNECWSTSQTTICLTSRDTNNSKVLPIHIHFKMRYNKLKTLMTSLKSKWRVPNSIDRISKVTTTIIINNKMISLCLKDQLKKSVTSESVVKNQTKKIWITIILNKVWNACWCNIHRQDAI